MNQLHCGACQTPMSSIKELDEHLKTCRAAKALLFPITKLMFVGESRAGHPVGSLAYLMNENHHLIKRYASAIANEMNSLDRAKIHHSLCAALALDYHKFKPFESEKILKIPSEEDAIGIIYDALGEELRRLGVAYD